VTFGEAWTAVKNFINTTPLWLASIELCIQEVDHLLATAGVNAAIGGAAFCVGKLAVEFAIVNPPPAFSLVLTQGPFTGGSPMPSVCVPKHSSTVQGAGLCCQQVGAGLTVPPPGTVLPVYQKGQAAALPPGRIVQVTDSGGHCASCMVVGSTSPKHPGRPVLKFIRGGPSCPTSRSGCCSL
jgi:hypothetical protein